MAIFPILFALFFFIIIFLLSLGILVGLRYREEEGRDTVQVIVLGDIGRSPRMQYHSHSLTLQDFNVDIIGYGGYICTPLSV